MNIPMGLYKHHRGEMYDVTGFSTWSGFLGKGLSVVHYIRVSDGEKFSRMQLDFSRKFSLLCNDMKNTEKP